jgi:polyisoprenoid-binding protein YceI
MKSSQNFNSLWATVKVAIVMLMLSPQVIMAQTYKLNPGKDVLVKVNGTSNVHDWSMTATGIESQGTFKFNSRDEMIDVTALKFTVLAKSLKSEKSSMDSRTYKSINADVFPKINYQLTFATVTMVQANKYSIQTTGNLTIAGKTQTISMKVTALVNADHSISCRGTEKIMLTDYGIAPPSFMLGAMKVGNDLTISFNLNYIK